MTGFPLRDPSDLGLGDAHRDSRTLLAMTPENYDSWLEGGAADTRDWTQASGFTGKAGKAILLPSSSPACAVAIIDPAQAIWNAATISRVLPAGPWSIHDDSDPAIDRAQVCLGWALAQYAFTTYRDAGEAALRSLEASFSLRAGTFVPLPY